MDVEALTTVLRLTLALVAGSLVGLERSYHGRTAGFREHTLVCISSCMLMLLADYHTTHIGLAPQVAFLDPTRMAQGIMTGIGFLGAGAIIKDGASIRGLTTAASVWMIAAIGIMIGMGYYLAAAGATFATLNINFVFRLIENNLHLELYANAHVRFARNDKLTENDLKDMAHEIGSSASAFAYTLNGDGRWVDYQFQLKTRNKDAFHALADKFSATPKIVEFSIMPRGD